MNSSFEVFSKKYLRQFHLKIPKDVINTVKYYRDEFFPYLKDSVYKSNMCYLLQLIDYQIWLYHVFRPVFSLENAYFYQLLVSMGIIAEALAAVILLDPVVESEENDRSLGETKPEYNYIEEKIFKSSFHKNIENLEKLKIIDNELTLKYQELRATIRNIVHVQAWQGRLYSSLNLEDFQIKLKTFKAFLEEIKKNAVINTDIGNLKNLLFPYDNIDEKEYREGVILDFFHDKGFGFIKENKTGEQHFFHVSSLKFSKETVYVGKRIKFQVFRVKKGIEAKNLTII
ncbi:MAG: cold shock domain-containing protein [Spirochaetia bacterium]|nr:cold shock domain-containing protein [Spirochaetia bacterium]